jgi:hypothetical protein
MQQNAPAAVVIGAALLLVVFVPLAISKFSRIASR